VYELSQVANTNRERDDDAVTLVPCQSRLVGGRLCPPDFEGPPRERIYALAAVQSMTGPLRCLTEAGSHRARISNVFFRFRLRIDSWIRLRAPQGY